MVAAGIYLPVSATPAGKSRGQRNGAEYHALWQSAYRKHQAQQFVANGSKELIGKNLEVFGDFLFSQTTNGGSALAPSPIAGVGPGAGILSSFRPTIL